MGGSITAAACAFYCLLQVYYSALRGDCSWEGGGFGLSGTHSSVNQSCISRCTWLLCELLASLQILHRRRARVAVRKRRSKRDRYIVVVTSKQADV